MYYHYAETPQVVTVSVCNLLVGVMVDRVAIESPSTHRGGTAMLPTPVIGRRPPLRRPNATRHEKNTPRTRLKIFLNSTSATLKPSTSMPRRITTANAWKGSELGLCRLFSVIISPCWLNKSMFYVFFVCYNNIIIIIWFVKCQNVKRLPWR